MEAVVVERPKPEDVEQNLCLDKAYDSTVARKDVVEHGYVPHVKARGEEATELKTVPGARARRWVVEACHSWFNKFRKLAVRFEKKAENYAALLYLAAAAIAWRHARPDSRRDGMILG